MPELSLFNLNILGKMGFGALGGFEYIAILAGETRAPARARSGARCSSRRRSSPSCSSWARRRWSPTCPTNDIDLVGPMPQVLRVGFGPFGIAGSLVTIAILMTLAMRLAQVSVSFTAVTRLPMVAGWDRLLPAAFSKLHPRYRTPVNSIMLVAACAFVISLLEPDRRRPGRGVPVAVQRRRRILRAGVRGDVRDPAVRAARRDAAAVAAAANRLAVGPADDAALHRRCRSSRSSRWRACRASR